MKPTETTNDFKGEIDLLVYFDYNGICSDLVLLTSDKAMTNDIFNVLDKWASENNGEITTSYDYDEAQGLLSGFQYKIEVNGIPFYFENELESNHFIERVRGLKDAKPTS